MTRIVHCATTIVAERLRVICANAKPVQRGYYECSTSHKFHFQTFNIHLASKAKRLQKH